MCKYTYLSPRLHICKMRRRGRARDPICHWVWRYQRVVYEVQYDIEPYTKAASAQMLY